MHKFGKYRETDSMSDLVADNYRILLIMSRFGIGLGFGDKNISEVCDENEVDTKTFLTVTNMLLDMEVPADPLKEISIESLVTYLHNSHDYFLGYRLPEIRNKLADTVGSSDELSRALINYFDEYISEVNKHMKYEETVVFPYVRNLLKGVHEDYCISVFSKQHDQVEARLSEFKNLLIRYYPSQSTNQINGILFDIFNCENDLAMHNAVEDRLFIPAVRELESNKNKQP